MQQNGDITHQSISNEQKNKATLTQLASVGEIAAGMAHEVRNPLTAVKGFLDLLKQESPHPYLDIASQELENAISTLSNLLQVSKPDINDELIVSIHLCSELESILNLFQDQIYKATIHKKLQNCDEVIYGKKNLLKKAFFNLIKNAFEAIPDKGEIEIEHFRLGKALIIIIRDNGVGISQDKLDLIGTPFFSTKDDGTGLGLAQVYSTIYSHGGKIQVCSHVNQGTVFTIEFQIEKKIYLGVNQMDFEYREDLSFGEFLQINKEFFNDILLSKSSGFFLEIQQNKNLENDYLLNTAYKIIDFIENKKEHELIVLAKEKGEYWAKMNFSLILIFEWMQTIRQTYFNLLFYYHNNKKTNLEDYFQTENERRMLLDTYMTHFMYNYTQYYNNLLKSQREIVESLTVPIISLSDTTAILPVIGTIDTFRAKKMQERTLDQISRLRIKQLIIDLSGVAYMDTAVVNHLFKVIDGVRLLGCKAIITGIRPEIANTVIEMGIKITDYVEAKGTLQQALEEYGVK